MHLNALKITSYNNFVILITYNDIQLDKYH